MSSFGNWGNGSNPAPICADTSPFTAWSDWDASQRDLFILDHLGEVVFHENISSGIPTDLESFVVNLASEVSDCNPEIACAGVLTCCDGLLYPTSCCADNCDEPIDDAEAGSARIGLLAGSGLGDVATGGISINTESMAMTNALLVASTDFYGPKSMVANASSAPYGLMTADQWVRPSKDVPYVIVRDNVCLVYEVGDNFTSEHVISVRLEVAQISLDQATLNQLLRTQTV